MEKATSTFPKLEGAEAQERFLTSPEAVLQSIGLRVPAALATQLLRRSSVPPPPTSTTSASAPQAAAASVQANAQPAPIGAEAKSEAAMQTPQTDVASTSSVPASKPTSKRKKAHKRR